MLLCYLGLSMNMSVEDRYVAINPDWKLGKAFGKLLER
jgi:hypothetical protein